MRANFGLNVLAISTIALTFIICITFVVVLTNAAALKTLWAERIQMIVYLKRTATPSDVERARRLIESLPEVRSLHFVSRDDALQQFRMMLQGQDSILEGLNENPLGHSFELRLSPDIKDDEQMAAVAATLKKIDAVDDVEYGRAWIERFSALFDILKITGIVLAGLLFLFSLLIVNNTLKLLLTSRRDEIEIMKLVGATTAFIKTPLCIEGMLQGIIGVAIAILVVSLAGLAVREPLQHLMALYAGMHRLIFLDPLSCCAFLALGAGLGLAGSLCAVGGLEEIHA
ncbi:MAG: ABC transporter permease [Desulfobacterota bacterium]|nr:ABC transporter permease [Thermodesulfobacteriota bacterium]